MPSPFELLHPYFLFEGIDEGTAREAAVLWLRASDSRVPLLSAWMTDELRGARTATARFGRAEGSNYDRFRLVAFLREVSAAFPGEDRTHNVLLHMLDALPNGRAVRGLLEVCLQERLHESLWKRAQVRSNPHRAATIDALSAAGWLTAEQLAPLLPDHHVRAASGRALEALLPGSRDVVEPLTAHPKAATRKEALRIVRVVEPDFGREGIAVAPDAETLSVLVDDLQERGDPHGQLIALTRAIETASPSRALELSSALAAYVDEHREQLWHRQGGWPVRDSYRGRRYLCLDTGVTYRGQKNRGEKLVARMNRFLDRFAADIVEDQDRWTFCWTHPDSDVLLPLQEGEHYPHRRPLFSELSVRADTGFTWMRFELPFELWTPAFLEYLHELQSELGPLSKRDWRVMRPNAAGDDVISRAL